MEALAIAAFEAIAAIVKAGADARSGKLSTEDALAKIAAATAALVGTSFAANDAEADKRLHERFETKTPVPTGSEP